jgi:hypothetical protein
VAARDTEAKDKQTEASGEVAAEVGEATGTNGKERYAAVLTVIDS